MDLIAIAYLSQVTGPLSPRQIDALLHEAQDFNARAGVTGALLHSAGQFFQYIEGPVEGLAQVYARICASRRHGGIQELFRGPVPQRLFEGWHMGFAEAPRSLTQALANAEWQQGRHDALLRAEDGAPLRLLLDHWSRHGGR